MKRLFFFAFLSLIALYFPIPVSAASCPYGSMQVRVQKDESDPWKQSMGSSCYSKFRVGAMVDTSGRFVEDPQVNKDKTKASIKVIRPDGSTQTLSNGSYVYPTKNGTYRVEAKIKSSGGNELDGGACRADGSNSATVEVYCDKYVPATPNPNQCPYRSTQAGVRLPQDNPTAGWQTSLQVSCGQAVQLGSAHDSKIEYAPDTKLIVRSPKGNEQEYRNGDQISVGEHGTYSLKVTTRDRTGSACQNTAYIYANCPTPKPSQRPRPTPTPRPTPPSDIPTDPNNNPYVCTYQSTEARVRSLSSDWQEKIELSCGQTFILGGFHNLNFGQYASDLVMKVRSPWGRDMYLNNGASITVWQPGTYKLNVFTLGQAGKACTQEAKVIVKCEGWKWSWNRWFSDWWNWWK